MATITPTKTPAAKPGITLKRLGKPAGESRELAQQEARLAAQGRASLPEPLTQEEFYQLTELMQDAGRSNVELAGTAERYQLAHAEYEEARAAYLFARDQNQALHRQIAPLLHRLPVIRD